MIDIETVWLNKTLTLVSVIGSVIAYTTAIVECISIADHVAPSISCNLSWKSITAIAFSRVSTRTSVYRQGKSRNYALESGNGVIAGLASIDTLLDGHSSWTTSDGHSDGKTACGDSIDVAAFTGPSVVRLESGWASS